MQYEFPTELKQITDPEVTKFCHVDEVAFEGFEPGQVLFVSKQSNIPGIKFKIRNGVGADNFRGASHV